VEKIHEETIAELDQAKVDIQAAASSIAELKQTLSENISQAKLVGELELKVAELSRDRNRLSTLLEVCESQLSAARSDQELLKQARATMEANRNRIDELEAKTERLSQTESELASARAELSTHSGMVETNQALQRQLESVGEELGRMINYENELGETKLALEARTSEVTHFYFTYTCCARALTIHIYFYTTTHTHTHILSHHTVTTHA